MSQGHQMENELGRLILRLANPILKNRNHHLEALNLTAEQAERLAPGCRAVLGELRR